MKTRLRFAAVALLCALGGTPHTCPAQTIRTYMSNQGGWSGGTTYQKGDVVQYGGQAYVSAISNNSGNTPSVGSAYWTIFATVTQGGTSISLETNGNANATQTLLNIVCTGSTTCTNSGGTVTITSTAGSSSLSLTTTGSSGAATLSGGVLNIPQYTVGAGSSSPGVATVIIAASDTVNKAPATVTCTGTADDTCISNAISTYCPNSISGVSGCNVTLEPGVYSLSGANGVVIDNDDVYLHGENHCMWGGYEGAWPTPDGVGTGCAQLRVANTSVACAVTIQHNNPAGDGADTGRHRGIKIEDLYLVGDSYSGKGICNGAVADDNSHFSDNVIQHFSVGIQLTLDSGIIEKNSIQDNGGDAIQTGGVFVRTINNLLFDVGGNCITSADADAVISGNIAGDCTIGIYSTGDHAKVAANSISPTAHEGIYATGRAAAITGNTVDWQSSLYGYSSKEPTGYDAIHVAGAVGAAVSGNTIDTAAAQTGYAIDYGSTGTGAYSANSILGNWGGGVPIFASFGHTGNTELRLASGTSAPYFFATAASTHPACTTTDTTGAVSYATYQTASGGWNVTGVGTGTDYVDVICVDSTATGATGGNPATTTVSPTSATNTEATYSSVTLLADYDASKLASVTNQNLINAWPDASGNGHAMTSGTGTPRYYSSAPGTSKPAVYFDGSTSNFTGNIGTSSANITVCGVFYQAAFGPSSDGAETVFGSGAGAGSASAVISTSSGPGDLFEFQGSYLGSTNSQSLLNTPQVLCWVFGSAAGASYEAVNGTSSGTGGLNAGNTPFGSGVGLGSNISNSEYFEGYIGRIEIFNGTASVADMQAITSALRSEYSF